jgi:alkanesulfonate monooxygenase SsuD/methylene tetrahydromethanopterin reductase-like flavin-dependent oxidoreductase (luciferase family)
MTDSAGAVVFDNDDDNHPAILAEERATMDVLSSGRIEIGLGAGWMTSDDEGLGLAYDPPGIYAIAAYDGFPQPVQRPLPPILIGGGGRRVLGIVSCVSVGTTEIDSFAPVVAQLAGR